MTHKISDDRRTLTILADKIERKHLRELPEDGHQDAICTDHAMYEWFESLIGNSELDWIPEGLTGDLTSAPMLGILGEMGDQDHTVFLESYGLVFVGADDHHTYAQPILERWGFMDYQLRSPLHDLRDKGEAVFVNGN